MDCNYPHWYNQDCMEPCQEMPGCNYPEPRMHAFPDASFRDRLLCLLGNKILFSVDARLCGRESFCGTLCYVGCDFILVNVCLHRKPVSMHVPICMLRYFSPFK